MTLPFVLCIFTAVQTAMPQHQSAAKLLLPNDFFVIMPWNAFHGWGPERIERKHRLESIAQCGFNVAGFVQPEDLPTCQVLGLKAFIAPPLGALHRPKEWAALNNGEIDAAVHKHVGTTANHPSVIGYFIADEPRASHYPALAQAVAAVQRYAPGKIAYINLFPNHASVPTDLLPRLQTASYLEYAERFASEVHPQVISYDNYIVQRSMDMTDPEQAPAYFTNLFEIRQVSLKYGLPYWNVVVCNQIRNWSTIPSPANLMLQAYTSLAAGVSGVCWYTYPHRRSNR